MDAQELVTQYLEYAANEIGRTGRPRTSNTMTAFRRALEGFVKAVGDSGLPLTQLPTNFLEKHWLQTQGTALNQPIQLRVRAGAVKAFLNWAYGLGAPIAPIKPLELPTIPKPPKKELSMSDVTSLGDAFTADPVPSTTTYAPQQPAPVQYIQQPPQAQPVQTLPPQVLAPPPRAPAAPKPVGSGRPANPLAAMLPTGQFKLRVRREREMDDPVWVGDFPAERVQLAGAIEPFLGREVVPRLVAQGITGDVTFVVCSVSPDGREGERVRMTVAATPPVVQQVAAPVLGAPMASGSFAPNEMADMLSYHRRAQEELEERMAKRMEAQKPAPAPAPEKPAAPASEMEMLKQMMAQLAGSVQTLAAKVEAQQTSPQVMMPQQLGGFDMGPSQSQVPQLDILSLVREVATMSKPPPTPPAPPPMGMPEMLTLFGQMKQVFQPQNVNIDVSPIEEELRELKAQVAAQSKGKSRTMEMLEEFKAMKEVFSLVGGEQGASKPTGLSSALGSLVDKLVNDPEPIAAAAERVLSAAASLKAAQTGAPMPQQPAPYQPQARPQQPQADAVPPPVRSAMVAMLTAQNNGALVVATHEWLTMMLQVPQLKKVAEKLMVLLREEKETEFAIYLRQVFSTLGYAEQATPTKAQQIAAGVLEQVRASNEAGADSDGTEDADEGAEEQEGPFNNAPDLNVRVGGVQAGDFTQEEVQAALEEQDKPKRKRRSRKKKAQNEEVQAEADTDATQEEAEEMPAPEAIEALEAPEDIAGVFAGN